MGRYTPQTPCAPRAAKHPLRVCSAPRSLKYPRRKEVPPIDFCHIPVSIIKRSEGRSAVAAAAYRSGTKLTNEWDGLTHDYTRKGGVVHAEIMLPVHAPPEFADRSTLWNSVEQIEKARDSQLAREIEAALPRELSREQQLALVRAYVKDSFVAAGMCADFALHDEPFPKKRTRKFAKKQNESLSFWEMLVQAARCVRRLASNCAGECHPNAECGRTEL